MISVKKPKVVVPMEKFTTTLINMSNGQPKPNFSKTSSLNSINISNCSNHVSKISHKISSIKNNLSKVKCTKQSCNLKKVSHLNQKDVCKSLKDECVMS